MRRKCLGVVRVVIAVGSSRSVLGGVLGGSFRVVVVVPGVPVENSPNASTASCSRIAMRLLRVMERLLFLVLLPVAEISATISRCVSG